MLIKCTECNHDVSDKAEKCPNCGCPVEEIKKCIKSKKREQMVNILVSQKLTTHQQNKKKYDEEWIKQIIAEVDAENKRERKDSDAQKKIYCYINCDRADITWIKETIDKMDEVALEHCKYVWLKYSGNESERAKCLGKYMGTPQKVFYDRAWEISEKVRDKCGLSVLGASNFLYELIASNFELEVFYGETEEEFDERISSSVSSQVRCPYCGSYDTKKIFFRGGRAQKQWLCNNCRSKF